MFRMYGEYGKDENGYWMYLGNNLYDLINYRGLSWFKFSMLRLLDLGRITWERADECMVCKKDTPIREVGRYVSTSEGEKICNSCIKS